MAFTVDNRRISLAPKSAAGNAWNNNGESEHSMAIELTGIVKKFGNFTALDGVSLAARDGEFLALLGPSGSGKTTLLRILAGLDRPDSGSLKLQSQPVDVIRPSDRNVGLVFQHYALFRHMTVFDNVAFGLSVKRGRERLPKARSASGCCACCSSCSSAICRTAIRRSFPAASGSGWRWPGRWRWSRKLLLLDEPFGALDAKVRKELRRWLRGLHDSMGLTSIFVTHDQEEALELADRVVVMSQGKIEQIGTPAEIYDHPASPFVYQFIGNSNRFECDVARGQVLIGGQSFGGTGDVYPDGPALAFVRPHDLEIRAAGSGFGIPATVRQVFTAGNLLRVELDVQDGKQIVEVELDRSRNIGDLSTGRDVLLMPQRIKLFPRSGAEIPVAAPIRRLTQAG